MSVRRLDPVQPEHFAFSEENLSWALETIKKYPEGREASAVILLLWRAQEQGGGWLSRAAMEYVGSLLSLPYMRVYEVATFYTMFQLSPVGSKAHVQVCGTTPCMLRGSGNLIEVCRRNIAKDPHTLSADGCFSWEEVECLGACVNAPLVQIGEDTYEDLTSGRLEEILSALERGEQVKKGPQNGRWFSAPQGVPTTLIEEGMKRLKEDQKVMVDLGIEPPFRLSAPRGGMPDVLDRISGISPEVGVKLYALGIYHYDQIAFWSTAEALWVDRHLEIDGGVLSDNWMAQARKLLQNREEGE